MLARHRFFSIKEHWSLEVDGEEERTRWEDYDRTTNTIVETVLMQNITNSYKQMQLWNKVGTNNVCSCLILQVMDKELIKNFCLHICYF